ncbi:MAG: hypothetical protein JWO94_1031, partial [Verrucomicrobiaceae bacterium]|nr:hypothetical protein [Verrucomicrobiaceae bacterium]
MSHSRAHMDDGWHNDGTAQSERFPSALDPSKFKIDDRSIGDLLNAVAHMAQKLRFNEGVNWQALLPHVAGLAADDSVADEEASASDWQVYAEHAARHARNPPHVALLITFLRLFRHHQAQVNLLTKGNLDHYYRRVLGFRQNPAQPDHLCVFPSLMPKVIEHYLPAGTPLAAGMDAEGNALVYTLDNEIVITRAKVAIVKAISHFPVPLPSAPPAAARQETWLRTAPFVEGKPIPWRPFSPVPGASPKAPAAGSPVEAPLAEQLGLGIGTAISSPLLFLQEGQRVITLEFNQAPGISCHCCISTPEGWFFLDNRIEATATSVVITVPSSAPPLAAVNPKVHLDTLLPTDCPAIKFYVSAASQETYEACVEKVRLLAIQVTVTGVKGLKLANEAGPVDPSQPFLPFGAHPAAGANFRFAANEMKAKPVTRCALNFDWLDRGTHRIQIDQLLQPPSPDRPDTMGSLHLFDKTPADEDDTTRLTHAHEGFTLTLAGKADPFGHASYPRRVADWAVENAVRVAHEMTAAYHADGPGAATAIAIAAPVPTPAPAPVPALIAAVPPKDPPAPAPPETLPPPAHPSGLAALAKKALGFVREITTGHAPESEEKPTAAPVGERASGSASTTPPVDPRYPP